jgi:HAD superfamily hydrolase (TIGR01509 family)
MDLQDEVMDLFDGIMISGDEGLVKPDIAFYSKCLKKFNLAAAETLFVDDQMINVEGARKVGMHSFLFEYKSKKSLLKNFQEYNIVRKEIII